MPRVQVPAECQVLGVEEEPTLPVRKRLCQLGSHLGPRLAVDRPPLAALGRVDGVLAHPASILAAAYAALAVAPLSAHPSGTSSFIGSSNFATGTVLLSCYYSKISNQYQQ